MPGPDLLLLASSAIFCGTCITIACTDILRRRIPNRLILLLMLGAPLLLAGGQMPPGVFVTSLALALGLLLLGGLFFARGWIGGGDVKLICALTLWFPPGEALWFVYLALLFGGVLALVVLALRLAMRRGLVPMGATQRRLLLDSLCVPYGVSIGTAAILNFSLVWL